MDLKQNKGRNERRKEDFGNEEEDPQFGNMSLTVEEWVDSSENLWNHIILIIDLYWYYRERRNWNLEEEKEQGKISYSMKEVEIWEEFH